MHAFEVAGETGESFVLRVREAIAARGFTHIVSVSLEDGVVVVRFSWMGRSVLRYRIHPWEEGFRAELEEERMAALHAPFRAGFEERFERIIGDVGGRVL